MFKTADQLQSLKKMSFTPLNSVVLRLCLNYVKVSTLLTTAEQSVSIWKQSFGNICTDISSAYSQTACLPIRTCL